MVSAKAQVVDFTDVKDASKFNTKRIPSGDYLARIIDIEDTPTKANEPQWTLVIRLEKRRSTILPYRVQFSRQTLWKLRALCLACGLQVPRSKVKVDPNKLMNKLLAVVVVDDEYEGKLKSQIDNVFPASELEDSGDANSDDDEDGEDDEDEDDDGEYEGEGDEEAEEEPEPARAPAPRGRTAAKKSAPAARPRKPAPVRDEDLDELDIDDM